MSYNEKRKIQNMKYIAEKQHRVAVNWLKEDFEGRVKPAIDKTGMPVSTFIKTAVNEKIENDKLDNRRDILPHLKDELKNMEPDEQQKIFDVIKVLKKD